MERPNLRIINPNLRQAKNKKINIFMIQILKLLLILAVDCKGDKGRKSPIPIVKSYRKKYVKIVPS